MPELADAFEQSIPIFWEYFNPFKDFVVRDIIDSYENELVRFLLLCFIGLLFIGFVKKLKNFIRKNIVG